MIEGVFRPVGGVLASTPERVSPEGASGFAPRVAFDGHGRAMAVWVGTAVGKTGVLEAARPPGGGFGSAERATPRGCRSTCSAVRVIQRNSERTEPPASAIQEEAAHAELVVCPKKIAGHLVASPRGRRRIRCEQLRA